MLTTPKPTARPASAPVPSATGRHLLSLGHLPKMATARRGAAMTGGARPGVAGGWTGAGASAPKRRLAASVATTPPAPVLANDERDPVKEESRKYRRTVFFFDDWARHRGGRRYTKNMENMFKSRILSELRQPLTWVVTSAVFTCRE